MDRRTFLKASMLTTAAATVSAYAAVPTGEKPNIIFIMLDEWGYYEMSCLGHKKLKTPMIDKVVSEGLRFTHAYAGAPVCGPTRSCLQTGTHMGHTTVRTNGGYEPIREDDITIAQVLKKAGYATGGFGKWGIGGRGTSGVPEKHGYDEFFGYYDQRHAHTYYPKYLIHNSKEVHLPGNELKQLYKGETYSHTVIYNKAVEFIETNKDKPFFCYMPFTVPHGLWGFDKTDPAWAEFKDKPWKAGQRTTEDAKVYAAMMLQVDRQLGEIIALLKKHKIDENTIIFFCGDNGGQDYFNKDFGGTQKHHRGFFAPNKDPKTGTEFRDMKGSLYDGGLRIPMVARWPGKIKPGTTSDHLWYISDVMPTLAELAGVKAPEITDGISIVPTLFGKGNQEKHDTMYWEYGAQIAIRQGQWKAIRPGKKRPWELYDIVEDVSEKSNVAAKHPDVLKKLQALADKAHTPPKRGTIYDRELAQKDHQSVH